MKKLVSFSQMQAFVLALSAGMFGCFPKTTEPTPMLIDSLEHEPIYFALPLGITLDQYKAMYSIDRFRSEVDQRMGDYINFDCAVVVGPTDEEIAKMKTGNALDDESIEGNNNYNKAVSRMIELYGLKAIPTTERFINFRGERGSWELDMKRDWSSDWKVILFKKTKEPVVLPNILVTIAEIEDYFEISK